jgi:hypothetical protein
MPRGDVLNPGDKVWVLGTYIGTVDKDLVVMLGEPGKGATVRVVSDEVKPIASKEGGL